MKRSLIFLLAAGPLFVFGQRLDQPTVLKTFRFSLPMRRWLGDTAFFRPWRSVQGLPVRTQSELPVQFHYLAKSTVLDMQPDRMPCLVPMRMPERMPMSLRGNADPLPNALPRRCGGRSMYRKRTLVYG